MTSGLREDAKRCQHTLCSLRCPGVFYGDLAEASKWHQQNFAFLLLIYNAPLKLPTQQSSTQKCRVEMMLRWGCDWRYCTNRGRSWYHVLCRYKNLGAKRIVFPAAAMRSFSPSPLATLQCDPLPSCQVESYCTIPFALRLDSQLRTLSFIHEDPRNRNT